VRHFPSPDIGMFGRRQRHVRGHRVPVVITRTSTPGDGTVLVDAFSNDEVAPGDCRCCTGRNRLQRAVREHGRSANRVAIRTEADILSILRTFVAPRALGDDFYVEDVPPLEGHRFALTESAPLSWDAFSRFVATLQALRGADVLHAKGLMNIADCRGPVAVELMGHLAARPVELQAWPDTNRTSRLTFVTRGIDEIAVRKMFDAVRAL